MRWLWVFLTALAGALVGSRLLQDPGYVLVRSGSWVFESSIAVGAIALLGVILAMFMIGAGLRYLMTSLGMYGRWRSARQFTKSSDNWQQATREVAAGNWTRAGSLLAAAIAPPERRLEVLLVQAHALWQQQDHQALSALLARTRTDSPELLTDLTLAVARWQLSGGEARSALTYLSQIAGSNKASSAWAGLYAWGCIEQRQWEALQRHWPLVEKNGVLKDDAFRAQMPLLRAGEAMADSVTGDKVGASGSWRGGLKNLPKMWRADPNTLGVWAMFLINSGREEPALELLDHALSKNWHPGLLRQFGQFKKPGVVGQALEKASIRLQKTPDDTELLLTLGRLLNTNNQQAQARKHLLRAVQILGLASGGSQNPQELENLILTELGRSELAQ